MYAREIYGMMMAGALFLMTGCSADDVVKETTSEEPIAISFSCNYDGEPEQPTRAGHEGVMNTEDLYATGFGVMASVTANNDPEDPGYAGANKPNLMYNQEVEFTFVGDREELIDPEHTELGVKKGYWSYSPLKYWPTSLEHCYISAYAPYVDPTYLTGLSEEDLAKETGIIGISENSYAPYVDYRRCEKPSEVVDLLWYYKDFVNESGDTEDIPDAGILNIKMHHALARLEIKVALASDVELDAGTKVLIEKITLTGKMAKTGRLHLYVQTTEGSGNDIKYYPVWSNQTYDKDEHGDDTDHKFEITNIDNDTKSYGIIDSQVRYIEGLPYDWQPKGLKKYTPPIDAKNNGMQNALSTGDRVGYIYLIPQDELELTVEVKYHQMTSGSHKKTTTSSTVHIPPKPSEEAPYPPLKGNTTYTLNLTLKEIKNNS